MWESAVLLYYLLNRGFKVIVLMIYILHYLKDPKLWEFWHIFLIML